MKRPTSMTIVCLSLLSFAGLDVAGCSTTECAALCGGTLRAGGEIEMPAGEPDLLVALCVGDDCRDSQLGIDDAGVISCDGGLECDLEEIEGGVRLWVRHSEAGGFDLEVGDEIHVTVQVAETGEKLVDTDVEVSSVSESTLCGSTCTSALALWDE